MVDPPLPPYECPLCHNIMLPTVAKGGRMPGYAYVFCPPPCGHHHRFPRSSQNSVDNAPSAIAFSQAGPSSSASSSSHSLQCSVCAKPANGNCANRLCKNHCILNKGGCHLTDHKASRLSSRQKAQLSVSPALPSCPPTKPFHTPSLRDFTKEDDEEEAQLRQALTLSLKEMPLDPLLASPPAIPSVTPQRPNIRTVPYKAKTITRHMNDDWMREPADKTKHPKKSTSNSGLDTCFSVVFWGSHRAEPVILAVHDCPRWPKWILEDAIDLYDDFGFKLNDAPSSRKLQYFSFHVHQWITCASAYPHSVKKDSYLLLRARGLKDNDCLGFEAFEKLALSTAPHFRDNLAGERAAIRSALHERRAGHLNVISPSDVDNETIRYNQRKRQRDGGPEAGPSQRRRLTPPPLSPPWFLSPPAQYPFGVRAELPAIPTMSNTIFPSCSPVISPSRSLSRSPSIVISSPRQIEPSNLSRSPSITISSPQRIPSASPSPPSPRSPLRDIQLPANSKNWLKDIHAVDMVEIFKCLDSAEFKKKYPDVDDRIHAVVGWRIPYSTLSEQQRHWNRAHALERRAVLEGGRSAAGLWTEITKHGRGRSGRG